jgi:predicted anti-sigma-YlaC factor YlaD
VTGAACRPIRVALTDAAAQGFPPPWPLERPVVVHLDGCAACRHEAEGLALASHTMRRFAIETATLEPSPETWSTLRTRVTRGRRRRMSLDVAGAVAALSLATVLMAHVSLPQDVWTPVLSEQPGVQLGERLVDRRYDPPARVTAAGLLAVAVAGPSAPPAELRLVQVALDRSIKDPISVGKPVHRDAGIPARGSGPA